MKNPNEEMKMSVNLNEAIQKIKQAGANNARAVPMPGENVTEGNYQIEINTQGKWVAIVTGIKKKIAEDIISQATNRVILG
jgi:cytochrome c551/c552